MAKAPQPGRVKTRLQRGADGLSAERATAVYKAMLACVVDRLAEVTPRLVLAADEPDHPAWEPLLRGRSAAVVAQGGGDLGDRMSRAWAAAGAGPAAFFGTDCPDLPAGHLAAVLNTLKQAGEAVGPVGDGGYWTLVTRGDPAAFFNGVEWGGPDVLTQTLNAAEAAGRPLSRLPAWLDVDHPADLEALVERLAAGRRSGGGGALHRLYDALAHV